MFPVGHMIKTEVKQLAKELAFNRILSKHESRGICFIGKRKFQDFIKEYVDNKPGNFVDIETGEILGQHNGIHNFAIGQGVGLPNRYFKKMFAIRKMMKDRAILVAPGSVHPALYSNLFYTDKPHWIASSPFERATVVDCVFRFQHTHPFRKCKLFETNDGLLVHLTNGPVRSIKVGQFAAFYDGEECLGGARINNAGPMQFS